MELQQYIEKHLKEVEQEYGMSGLSSSLYADYAIEVTRRTIASLLERWLETVENCK